MLRPVIKAAKKGKSITNKIEKELSLNSSKNTLKVYRKYVLVLDEYSSG